MDEKIRTRLPQDFVSRMQQTLGSEYEAFAESYDSPRAYGLRRNPLKLSREQFETQMPFSLEKVSWVEEGYYYVAEERPGKHALHEAGAYYIQEPSAMSVVEILAPQPGEVILDLCAAPGGKSTQIAGRMQGQGLLISNEIVPNRAKILAQNVERMGICNAVVLNHAPDELERRFPVFFDRIVVDAPCSGEGMFHKEEAALTEWSLENVAHCANRQQDILQSAINMLRPGGVLVYSTCTFAEAEDEEMVQWILENYSDMELVPIDVEALGISSGTIEGTARIWPHKQRGEGHFIARFRKQGTLMPRVGQAAAGFTVQVSGQTEKLGKKAGKSSSKKSGKADRGGRSQAGAADAWKEYESFASETFASEPFVSDTSQMLLQGSRLTFGEQLYLLPEYMPALQGLKVLRPGLQLGEAKKNRFEPSHALALALRPQDVQRSFETEEPERYLRGETLSCDADFEGWLLVTYMGLPLGWGKASRGIIKNHYPKGLRINW